MVSGVARTVPLEVIFKGVIPLLIALVVGVALMIPFPQIALFLPSLIRLYVLKRANEDVALEAKARVARR